MVERQYGENQVVVNHDRRRRQRGMAGFRLMVLTPLDIMGGNMGETR